MEARIVNYKFFLIYLLFLPSTVSGQIKNELDIQFKERINLQSDRFPTTFTDKYYGYISPTLLGNVKVGTSFETAILYSGLSYFLQPSFNIGFTNYNVNAQILRKFNNFKFNSYSFGIGCKINIINYSKRSFIPYIILNSGYRLSRLESDETKYSVTTTNAITDARYAFTLQIPSNSKTFFNPYLETDLGLEIKLLNRIYIVLEGNLVFINYPKLDISYPTLSKELYISLGFRYKLYKNKRFYYD